MNLGPRGVNIEVFLGISNQIPHIHRPHDLSHFIRVHKCEAGRLRMLRNQTGHPRVSWGVETVVDFGRDGILAKTRRSDLHKILLQIESACLSAYIERWLSAVQRRFLRTLSRVRSSSHFLLTCSANPGRLVSGIPAIAKLHHTVPSIHSIPCSILGSVLRKVPEVQWRPRAVAHRIGTTAAIRVVVQQLGLNHVSRTKSGISLNPMSLSL